MSHDRAASLGDPASAGGRGGTRAEGRHILNGDVETKTREPYRVPPNTPVLGSVDNDFSDQVRLDKYDV